MTVDDVLWQLLREQRTRIAIHLVAGFATAWCEILWPFWYGRTVVRDVLTGQFAIVDVLLPCTSMALLWTVGNYVLCRTVVIPCTPFCLASKVMAYPYAEWAMCNGLFRAPQHLMNCVTSMARVARRAHFVLIGLLTMLFVAVQTSIVMVLGLGVSSAGMLLSAVLIADRDNAPGAVPAQAERDQLNAQLEQLVTRYGTRHDWLEANGQLAQTRADMAELEARATQADKRVWSQKFTWKAKRVGLAFAARSVGGLILLGLCLVYPLHEVLVCGWIMFTVAEYGLECGLALRKARADWFALRGLRTFLAVGPPPPSPSLSTSEIDCTDLNIPAETCAMVQGIVSAALGRERTHGIVVTIMNYFGTTDALPLTVHFDQVSFRPGRFAVDVTSIGFQRPRTIVYDSGLEIKNLTTDVRANEIVYFRLAERTPSEAMKNIGELFGLYEGRLGQIAGELHLDGKSINSYTAAWRRRHITFYAPGQLPLIRNWTMAQQLVGRAEITTADYERLEKTIQAAQVPINPASLRQPIANAEQHFLLELVWIVTKLASTRLLVLADVNGLPHHLYMWLARYIQSLRLKRGGDALQPTILIFGYPNNTIANVCDRIV